jgi:hypothetical protein
VYPPRRPFVKPFQSEESKSLALGASTLQPTLRTCRPEDFDLIFRRIPSAHAETFRALQTAFSSGVSRQERVSIADVVCRLSGLKPPSRDVRRAYLAIVGWFGQHWHAVNAYLPLIHLCDDNHRVINGSRELFDRYSVS